MLLLWSAGHLLERGMPCRRRPPHLRNSRGLIAPAALRGEEEGPHDVAVRAGDVSGEGVGVAWPTPPNDGDAPPRSGGLKGRQVGNVDHHINGGIPPTSPKAEDDDVHRWREGGLER